MKHTFYIPCLLIIIMTEVSCIHEDITIPMFRTKSKLLIITEYFPTDITDADVTIQDVYRTIGMDMAYSGSNEVTKSFTAKASDKNSY